jgi:hypothetical protein
MVDIIDIAPVTEPVEVRGHKLEARGIRLGAAAEIMQRFPEVWQMLKTGGKTGHLSDPAVAAIIAAGVDGIDEAGAANLEIDEQMDLVGTIWGLTVRRGVDPFMKALVRFTAKLTRQPAPKTPAASSGPQTEPLPKRASAKRSPKS